MNTNLKIQLARHLYRLIKIFRSLTGTFKNLVICKRNHLKWQLDLEEGIDLSIYFFGAFEPRTWRSIQKKISLGDIVLDIGANVGAHALPMAKAVGHEGRVYAIEATDWAFQKMLVNQKLNPELQQSLIPLQVLLTDKTKELPQHLHSSWNLFKENVHPVHGGTLNTLQQAQVMSLDELIEKLKLQKIDFIKIDVDGFECQVFRGAIKTLTKFRPHIILELCPYVLEEQGDSIEAYLQLLKDFRYSLRTQDDKSDLPMNGEELRMLIPEKGGINALACPILG